MEKKMSMKKESMYWADQLADAIINREKYSYINKKVKNQKTLIIKSSTSISGVPHIGNACDVVRHYAVVQALNDKGYKAKLIWVGEDMDALRKVPAGIPKSFKKYLGMPVADIPCPEGCCKSYSMHFCKKFTDSLKEHFGIELEMKTTSESYRKGEFYDSIKKIMGDLHTVREIINKSRKEPLPYNWIPWKPVCDKCGKLMTTIVTGMDGDKVNYECRDYSFKVFGKEAYTELKGCGYKGVSDLKKGNGKMLWRVEWGMLWKTWKIVLEGAGKEHFMPTASFWSAGEIAERVLDWPEPHPAKNPIQGYEYIIFDGEKMSASRGNVVATWEWPNLALPETLKMFMLKKPSKVRDMPLTHIYRSYDELDELEQIYFEKKLVRDKKKINQAKRLYEMSLVGKPNYLQRVPYQYCSLITQVIPGLDRRRIKSLLDKTTYKLSKLELDAAMHRINLAANWAVRYLPEDEKIVINKKTPNVSLSAAQKNALKELAKFLRKDCTEEQLYSEFYKIKDKYEISTGAFFQACYKVILNKERGPRLAPFILAAGRDKIKNLLLKV